MANFFQNTRKPKGLGGKIMLSMMNSGHAGPSKWALSHLLTSKSDCVLDIGCGGGANIAQLLQMCSEGHVSGIDHSALSVEKSIKVNQTAVDAGRCSIVQGDASALPYEAESFDIVTAFETIYFWPDIEKSFKDIYKILKNSGQFMIANEVDGEKVRAEKWQKIIEGMRVYSATEIEQFLKNAGFTDIIVNIEPKKYWLCMIAKK